MTLRQTEARLHEKQTLAQSILDASPNLITVKDRNGCYVHVNQTFLKFFGVTLDQVIGKRFGDIVAADFDSARLERFAEEDREVFTTGERSSYLDERIPDAQGNYHWFQANKLPMLSVDGRHDYILNVSTDITERKLAEEALEKRDLLFRAMAEATHHLLSAADYAASVNFALATLGKAMGIDRVYVFENHYDLATGQPLNSQRFEWVRASITAQIANPALQNLPYFPTFTRWYETLSQGKPIEGIVRLFPPAERALLEPQGILSLLATPIMVDGQFWGFIGFDDCTSERDWSDNTRSILITLASSLGSAIARKQVTDQLRQQEKFPRDVLDAIPSHIFVKDRTNRYVLVNEAFAQFLGKTPSDVIGRDSSEFIKSKEEKKQQQREDQLVLENGKEKIVPLQKAVDKAGAVQWYQSVKRPLTLENGHAHYLVGVTTNITKRKLAEDALATERNLLRTLIDHLPDYIYIKDRKGRFVMVNAAHLRLLRADALEKVTGKTDFDFFPEARARVFANDEQKVLETGQPLLNQIEILAQESLERPLWVLTTKLPLRDNQGNIHALIGISRDITSLKEVEAELRRAKDVAEAATQAKTAFLANMSHEIRTPINAIVGMTSLLLDTTLTADQRDFVETIRTGSDNLLSLINDILDFSKVESGKLEVEAHPLMLSECIETTLDLFAAKAAEKGLELAYVLDEQVPPTIVSDATRLRQILVNLVSNALKFTQQGEVVITVNSEPRGDYHEVHFTVRDTGIGIPPERMNRLFQSFSQVDASTSRKYGGTGLGLVISKRLCELMGGTMWVESETNKGSTFHFTILAQAIAAQPLRQHDFYALQGKRVLVVDDTEVNRMILVHLTKRWGMTPVAVASGPEALAELNGGATFDLAILDMQMPEMNGMALVGAVRKRTEAKELPLVLLTSLGKPRHGENGQPSELAAVLNKPVKPSQLLDTLLRIFDRQSALPKMLDSAPVKSQFDQIRGDLPALRILLAEDNIVNQKVATRILQRLGYRADIAANGFEVLTALERQAYDVVFMDVHMPELDGLETTLRIRQHPNLSNQPYIIAMTADVVLGYRELCIEAGMNDYVSKPVRLEELVAALRRVQVSG